MYGDQFGEFLYVGVLGLKGLSNLCQLTKLGNLLSLPS